MFEKLHHKEKAQINSTPEQWHLAGKQKYTLSTEISLSSVNIKLADYGYIPGN